MTKKSSDTYPLESILKTPFWPSTSKRTKSSWVKIFRTDVKNLQSVMLIFFAGDFRIVIVDVGSSRGRGASGCLALFRYSGATTNRREKAIWRGRASNLNGFRNGTIDRTVKRSDVLPLVLMALTDWINRPVLTRKTVPITLITTQIPPNRVCCHIGITAMGSRNTALELYTE